MKILITGGAGFIGSNLTSHFLNRGDTVRVLDNLSRRGTSTNLAWLRSLGIDFEFIQGDIRNFEIMKSALEDVDVVYHLAAQVAVTTSVVEPRHDFEVNLLGTFNLVEAARLCAKPPMIIYTSTNKVYGKMDQIAIVEKNGRWEYSGLDDGNPESTPLDFYSPYGCSKGGADQYIHDYGRIYGIPTTVFRMSCIYGPRQMGCEDQGWVAFFLIQAILNQSVTLFGDGKQIRDVLFVEDLVDAFVRAYDCREKSAGQVYNIGGGPRQTLSLLELIDFIENEMNLKLPYTFDDWRPGDQKVYVSDIRKAETDLGWKPRFSPAAGLKKLGTWVEANRNLFENFGTE